MMGYSAYAAIIDFSWLSDFCLVCLQGYLVAYLDIQPFIVSLAGLFSRPRTYVHGKYRDDFYQKLTVFEMGTV